MNIIIFFCKTIDCTEKNSHLWEYERYRVNSPISAQISQAFCSWIWGSESKLYIDIRFGTIKWNLSQCGWHIFLHQDDKIERSYCTEEENKEGLEGVEKKGSWLQLSQRLRHTPIWVPGENSPSWKYSHYGLRKFNLGCCHFWLFEYSKFCVPSNWLSPTNCFSYRCLSPPPHCCPFSSGSLFWLPLVRRPSTCSPDSTDSLLKFKLQYVTCK